MRRYVYGLLAAGIGLLFAAAPLLAHHSFAAQYDSKKTLTIKGAVTKVEFMNPHIYFYVDVKDANGKVTNYAVEGGTPNSLRRRGWGKDALKVGDIVTVEGWAAKNGAANMNGNRVTLADGRRVFAGTSNPDAQQGGDQ
jgi:hypothetical protein